LLSISQTTSGFYCIEWTPTENGPRIVNSKYLKIYNSIENKGVLEEITSHFSPIKGKDSKSLSITLNIDKFFISEIKRDKNMIDQDYIKWYEENIINEDYKKMYDLFYFPLVDKLSYIAISISKSIKNDLIRGSSKLGYNLRYLSIDIFSSATLLKSINNIDNFLIWKIGKNNNHYLLNIIDSKISAYCKFKKQSNTIVEIIKIGDNHIVSEMHNLLTSLLINNNKNTSFSKIFIYQTSNSEKNIKSILSSEIENIELFNIVNLFDSKAIFQPIKSSKYVENGISFRGIDV